MCVRSLDGWYLSSLVLWGNYGPWEVAPRKHLQKTRAPSGHNFPPNRGDPSALHLRCARSTVKGVVIHHHLTAPWAHIDRRSVSSTPHARLWLGLVLHPPSGEKKKLREKEFLRRMALNQGFKLPDWPLVCSSTSALTPSRAGIITTRLNI